MQTLLLVDDDPLIHTALSEALEREGRRVIVCADIESAEIVVEHEAVTDIVSDVKLSSRFRYEGLDFITHARRHAPNAGVVLITGETASDLADEARQRGALTVLTKPFEVATLESFLSSPEEHLAASIDVVPTLDKLVADPRLHPSFQPIVTNKGELRGFESLARFDADSPIARPDLLFAYAERKGKVIDLEIACMDRTFRAARALPDGALLFMNVHPAALQPKYTDCLIDCADRNGIALDRVVLEITEQQPLRDEDALFELFDQIRARGVRFALDDVGVAYSHLPLIERIRPSFIKISQLFGTDFERHSTHRRIVRNLVDLGRDFSCDVILEGVESEATAEAARALEIPLLQGYYFGRPAKLRG